MAIYHVRPDREHSGWRILKVAGIPFYVEPFFLIVLAIFMLQGKNLTGSIQGAGLLGFIIFFSLMAHEAGHAFASRLAGLREVSVTLHGFGGVTQHPPTTRGRSLLITLAGPLCTLTLMLIAGYLMRSRPAFLDSDAGRLVTVLFFYINLTWLIFNLLPIYPLDGGQIIYYGLSFLAPSMRALRWTAFVSIAGCVATAYYIFIYQGQTGNMFAAIILLFLFMQNIHIIRGS